jgi:hypothetical protein
MLEKVHHTVTAEDLLLRTWVQPAVRRDAADGRTMIVGHGMMQHGAWPLGA